jgi:hypothetical protein
MPSAVELVVVPLSATVSGDRPSQSHLAGGGLNSEVEPEFYFLI